VFDRYIELVGGPLDDYLANRLPDRGGRAADLGCGTGRHAWLLSLVFDEVVAVDVSEPMLQHAQRHRAAANIRYQQRDLTDVTTGKDGRFDLVVSAHTLHHVPDLPFALEQIRSLVRPGGHVILVDNVDPRHHAPRRWLVSEARKALLSDLRHRRPVRRAVEVYRLSTHPSWLDHVSTDVFLTAAEFADIHGRVFPGAEFTAMYRTMAMHWQEPDSA
jgi:SAM-dependent methyltransferase